MNDLFSNHWHHHGKLYMALAIGIAAAIAAHVLRLKMPEALGGDAFFLTYIIAFAWSARRHTADDLRTRAKVEDEGAGVVALIIFAVIVYTCAAIFMTLNDHKNADPVWLALLLAGAPLGWFVIHLNQTMHYSNIFYSQQRQNKKALDFHDDTDPGITEFLYFSRHRYDRSDIRCRRVDAANATSRDGSRGGFFLH